MTQLFSFNTLFIKIMKIQQKTLQFKIQNYDFIIVPRELRIASKSVQEYSLELQKGPQVLKKIEEHAFTSLDKENCVFHNSQSAKFKLQNERGGTLSWALYRFIDGQSVEFVDSLPINLVEMFGSYIAGVKKQITEYQRVLNMKSQNQEIGKAWELMKETIPHLFLEQIVVGKESGAKVVFEVQIKCQLDYLSEQQRKKKTKSIKSGVSSHTDLNVEPTKRQQQIEVLHPAIEIPHDMHQQIYQDLTINVPNKESNSQNQVHFKRFQVLSDIPEASNECSSTRNNGGDKNAKINAMMANITEQESQCSSHLMYTKKTQNYQSIPDHLLQRRAQSFGCTQPQYSKQSQRFHTQVKLQQAEEKKQWDDKIKQDLYNLKTDMRWSQIQNGNQAVDHQLEKEEFVGLETAPQSVIAPIPQINQPHKLQNSLFQTVEQTPKKNIFCIKFLLAVLLCAVFFGSMHFVVSHLNTEIKTHKKDKKQQSQQAALPKRKKVKSK